MYYLQSRYYNPEWGRFINADGILGQTGELLGHNIFNYCKNNPINKFDSEGFNSMDNLPIGGGAGGGLLEVAMIGELMFEKAAPEIEETSEELVAVAEKVKPTQIHHFLTDKSKVFTKQFRFIVDKYKLKLNDEWNKAPMPHQGRHPNAYHDYVLENIKKFDEVATGRVDEFLKLFNQLKQEIIAKPQMLTKKYWE